LGVGGWKLEDRGDEGVSKAVSIASPSSSSHLLIHSSTPFSSLIPHP
jgi:hypothetical protein